MEQASRLAAALAYITVFSLAPLLIIVIAIAGSVFGEEAARRNCWTNSRLSRQRWRKSLKRRLKMPTKQIREYRSIISIIVLLFGASGICRASRCTQHRLGGTAETGTRFN